MVSTCLHYLSKDYLSNTNLSYLGIISSGFMIALIRSFKCPYKINNQIAFSCKILFHFIQEINMSISFCQFTMQLL